MSSSFMIGATYETMTALDEFAYPIPDPVVEPHEYQEMDELDDGHLRARGAPGLVWIFPLFENIETRNQLKAICPGASADVVIQSILADGVFRIYDCIMRWTTEENQENYWQQNLRIEFAFLEEITGS